MQTVEMREAIRQALDEEMQRDPTGLYHWRRGR